jgi:uncharacterized protein
MKRLGILFLALVFSVMPARAEAPPACQGTDLLAKLKAESPSGYDAVLREAAAVPNGEAVFWKIEGKGVQPSYLLGTAHVTDLRVTGLPVEIMEPLLGASVIALELKELADEKALMMGAMRHARHMVLPPGQSLWDLIPDADEPAIRDNANLPPGAAKSIFGYQPWVVAGMLTTPACEIARKQAGIPSLDTTLARQAARQNATLVGLETMEEQLSVFARMPLDLQAGYLVAVARQGSKTLDYFETLISLYEQRLVTAYLPLVKRLEPPDKDSAAMAAFVNTDLVSTRNHTMARRAQGILAQGNAFIAVGALHLPGDDGLVELIRKAGYKVTPVN